jgi:hypothetical protein
MRVRDERAHVHAACDGVLGGRFDLFEIEPENDEVERLLGAVDDLEERPDSVIGLNDELQSVLRECPQSEAQPRGACVLNRAELP